MGFNVETWRALGERTDGNAFRSYPVEEFGKRLGEAFFDNFIGVTERKKEVFVEAIVNALEGTHEEKVKGIEALFVAMEIMSGSSLRR